MRHPIPRTLPALCALGLGLLAGCVTTHPDALHIEPVGVELVPSQTYLPSRHRGEQALAFVFDATAPFAAIAKDGRLESFLCSLRDADDALLSEPAVGFPFYDRPTAAPVPGTFLAAPQPPGVPIEEPAHARYRVVTFFGLRTRATINGPDDIFLTTAPYDHITCVLEGSGDAFTRWASNDFRISKQASLDVLGRASR